MIERLHDVVDSREASHRHGQPPVGHLKLLIAKLRRTPFGRCPEKLDQQIQQLKLRLESLEADEGSAPFEIPKTTLNAPEQAPRKPLPEDLPRDV
jgi:transposase